MIPFAHGGQSAKSDKPPPTPLTWDYATRLRHAGRWACRSGEDLALCTCAFGHTTRLTGYVHAVAADGTVTPSYVCPVTGCTFHEYVRLVDWDPAHVYVVVDIDSPEANEV
jgi:hypothetical protein